MNLGRLRDILVVERVEWVPPTTPCRTRKKRGGRLRDILVVEQVEWVPPTTPCRTRKKRGGRLRDILGRERVLERAGTTLPPCRQRGRERVLERAGTTLPPCRQRGRERVLERAGAALSPCRQGRLPASSSIRESEGQRQRKGVSLTLSRATAGPFSAPSSRSSRCWYCQGRAQAPAHRAEQGGGAEHSSERASG